MSENYLLLIAHDQQGLDAAAELERKRLAEGWNIVFNARQGVSLLTNGNIPLHLLLNGSGAVLGNCQCRNVPAHAFEGDETAARQVTEHLLHGTAADHYWGNFLAIFSPDGSPAARIYRPPFSSLQAFLVTRGGLTAVSDSLALLRGICGTFSIHWPRILSALQYETLQREATALSEVAMVGPGEEMEVNGVTRSRVTRWTPARHIRTHGHFEYTAQAEEIVHRHLRRAVMVAAGEEHPVIDFSGGLDSGLIAGVLRDGGRAFTCANFRYGDRIGDERDYASAAADFYGAELIDCPLAVNDVDLVQSRSLGRPFPCAHGFGQALDAAADRVAATSNGSLFLNGHGGDNIFCYLASSGPAADALRKFGPGLRFARTTWDVANAASTSVWEAGWKAIIKSVREPKLRLPRRTELLTMEARQAVPDEREHSWLADARTMMPGCYEHIVAIVTGEFHMGAFHRRRPVHYPMLSQPLVETCLRVPSWMWIEGGVNRSLVRRAARKYLAPNIIARNSKGSFGDFVQALFEANRRLIHEMLLDGQLASAGLLDRHALHRAMQPSVTDDHETRGRILHLVDVEAWLRGATAHG